MTTEDFTLEIGEPRDGAVLLAASDIDVAAAGYIEDEFVCSGVATSYEGEPTEDGKWVATPASTARFTTRFVVRRPASVEDFSGTVLVEWLNVTSGADTGADWIYLHREITRAGMAWVGVSAQKAGIDGGGFSATGMHLKSVAPERYGELDHPGDAYSFDMYTQIARAVRGDAGRSMLGGLVPERILAIGESQSAAFLVTYANAIDPLVEVFDGYLIHGRGGSGAFVTGFRAAGAEGDAPGSIEEARDEMRRQTPHRIRTDVRVPVLVLQSETDVVTLGGGRARQEDGDRTRLWEIAGAAHADGYMLSMRPDDGTLTSEELAATFAPTTSLMGMTVDQPINTGAHQHYVGQAALAALDRWVRDGTPPPSAPLLELEPDADPDADPDSPGLVTDADGIARGGIRTPWVDVPTCRLSGLVPGGPGLTMLFGVTEIWSAERLAARYPGGRGEYLAAMRASIASAVDAGFLLAADVPEIDGLLAATYDRAVG